MSVFLGSLPNSAKIYRGMEAPLLKKLENRWQKVPNWAFKLLNVGHGYLCGYTYRGFGRGALEGAGSLVEERIETRFMDCATERKPQVLDQLQCFPIFPWASPVLSLCFEFL